MKSDRTCPTDSKSRVRTAKPQNSRFMVEVLQKDVKKRVLLLRQRLFQIPVVPIPACPASREQSTSHTILQHASLLSGVPSSLVTGCSQRGHPRHSESSRADKRKHRQMACATVADHR